MDSYGGMGAAGGDRLGRTRGRIQGGGTLAYPHPFFDLSSTYLPQSIKSLFRWLRHYFLTNGFFNTVVSKLAEYPITNLVFEAKSPETARKWAEYFEDHLRYRLFQVEVGLDYFVYGNAFVSVRHPFVKFLTCKYCKHSASARSIREKWTFTGFDFRLTCPSCGQIGPAEVHDQSTPSPGGVRLFRWSPEEVTVQYNPFSGTKTYYFDVPAHLRNDIILGRRHIVEEIPQAFIEAARKGHAVILPSESVYHMARPSISGFDRGWGIPLLLPVLKEGFQMQVLKKANETVLMEHLIPLRVLFPQPAAGTADPFVAVPLQLWKEQVASEIGRFRWDPNYIPILPLPIGQQTIGGEGKALMLDQQIQALAEQIVVQIGVPKEIIFGGAGWTGTNVSMRSVENFFLGYLTEHHGLFRFICRQLCIALNWTEAEGRFKPFRMAEDLQRKQLLAQLAQTGKPISNTTLLGEFDLDVADETALIIRETPGIIEAQRVFQTASTKLGNDVAALQGKAQAKMQQEMAAAQQPGAAPGEVGQPQAGQPVDPAQAAAQAAQPSAGAAPAPTAGYTPSADEVFNSTVTSPLGVKSQGIPLSQVAQGYAQTIASMPPEQAKVFLENIKNTLPEVYELVVQVLAQMQGAQGAGAPSAQGGTPTSLQLPATPGVNMTPMPEKLPPRRAGS